jgi:hypothetical protein
MSVRILWRWLAGVALAGLLLALGQLPAHGYIFLFKDGFTFKGKVRQAYTFLVDKKAHKAFSVPLAGSPYSIETDARYILFTPQQLNDILQEKEAPASMQILHYGRPGKTDLPMMWKYASVGPWDDHWERKVFLITQRGSFPDKQRMIILTPEYFQTVTVGHSQTCYFRTSELDLPTLRRLLQIKLDKMTIQEAIPDPMAKAGNGKGLFGLGERDEDQGTAPGTGNDKSAPTDKDKTVPSGKDKTVPSGKDKSAPSGKVQGKASPTDYADKALAALQGKEQPKATPPAKGKDKTKVEPPAPEAKYKTRPLTKTEKAFVIAKFLGQAGYTEEAVSDLEKLKKVATERKEEIDRELTALRKIQAAEFISDLETARKVGRHQETQDRIARFFKEGLNEKLAEKYVLQVFEFKSEYEKLNGRLAEAERLLKTLLPKLPETQRPFYQQATGEILKDLCIDTLGRLDTFVDQSRNYELALKQKRKPDETPAQLLAFALTGWLLGSNAAEPDVKLAVSLWEARLFILQYQKTADPADRRQLLQTFKQNNKLDLDVLARVIKNLPPPDPHAQVNTEVQQLQVALPGGGQGPTYYVQLPPEYNHLRPYPVLIVLQNVGESADTALEQWSKLAARYGFILMAPAWVGQFQTGYNYTIQEHQMVLQSLRDLKNHFQVDSDRVFLTGHAEGGLMTFDIGMSHPDLFAGILPMAAWPDNVKGYADYYVNNVQFLPIYTADGQRHGQSPEINEKRFTQWIRYHYPVLYISYKGRGREWFGGELPDMMDWMSRKKRVFPLRELGVAGNAAGQGELFRMMRITDNHFYWISAPSLIFPPVQKVPPSTLQASIYAQNEIHVQAARVPEITLWVFPGMIDFARKVTVKVNRTTYGPFTVQPNLEAMLEDYYSQGDRQRLFLARIDIKVRN